MIARGEPIIGGGAGTGLSAKCEEEGGIDLIVIYNSGRYRMAGRGSLAGLLAYGNANEIVVEMAREVLPVVRRTPVLAGVNGTDPFLLARRFPAPARRRSASRASRTSRPSASSTASFAPTSRRPAWATSTRSSMIRAARAHDLLTTPYVFSRGRTRRRWRARAPTSSSATWASRPAARSARAPR